MGYIEAQFDRFTDVFDILELVSFAFLILIVVETLWDFYKKKRSHVGETVANYSIALGNHLLDRTNYGLVFILGLFVTEEFAFFRITETWWSWLIALVVADLTYYWMHRFEHEIRVLWAYHSVHHSSPEYNLTTSMRLAWVEGIFEWLFFVPMILIGFSAIQTLIALAIVVSYQTWIHTEKIGKLGWIDNVLNTPSVHRVHHACNKNYLDKNYGGILMLWDHIFGTYQAEEEKVIYGIRPTVGSSNPIKINFSEFYKIGKDLLHAKSLREVCVFLFKSPIWVYEYKKSVSMKPADDAKSTLEK